MADLPNQPAPDWERCKCSNPGIVSVTNLNPSTLFISPPFDVSLIDNKSLNCNPDSYAKGLSRIQLLLLLLLLLMGTTICLTLHMVERIRATHSQLGFADQKRQLSVAPSYRFDQLCENARALTTTTTGWVGGCCCKGMPRAHLSAS